MTQSKLHLLGSYTYMVEVLQLFELCNIVGFFSPFFT